MSAIDPLDVLAILEERPYLEEELVTLFGAPADVVRFVLKGLFRSNQVKRVGAERRWALASYQAPAQRPHLTKPARILRDVEKADEDDEAVDEVDEDVDGVEDVDTDEELPPAPQRERGQRRLYPSGTRQAKTKAPIAAAPGWWVKYAAPDQREAFRDAAAERNAEMCATSPNWRTQTTVRQERETR